MSKSLLLISCIVIGLLVIACARTEETNKNAAAPATASSPVAPPTNRNDNTGATVQVGVAECDTFLTAYENCVTTKVPEAARAQFRTTMTTWRTEWKKLADNPQTRPTLVNVCKTQMETARTQMKAYNCTF